MIDEKKLIEEFREKAKGYDKDCGYWSKRGEHGNELLCAGKCSGIVQAIKIAENQPKVGEWIPCSERLPDNYTNVIACFATGTVTELRYIGGGVFSGIYEYNTEVITAWQPLPEPFKLSKE